MAAKELTRELLDELETYVRARLNATAGLAGNVLVSGADVLSLIAAMRELEAAKERVWDEGAEAALDGVPGSDEYASAIAAHARGLVNPYRQPKGPTK